MEKTVTHFIVLAVLFFGSWFLLSKINLVEIFHIEQLTKNTEHKLGELVLESIKRESDEVESDSLKMYLDSLKIRLCKSNSIEDSSITIYVLKNSDVNAFALPDRQLVIYTGLIKYCSNAEELTGVMAHEIAHMEHDHVMKKLLKEIGLGMIITATGGGSGGEVPRRVVKLLSSTAFDREQEAEADASAVHMMAKSDIDPEHFANFLFRLSREKNDVPKRFEMLSTHPNSQDRSAEVLKLRKKEIYNSRPVLNLNSWEKVKELANEAQDTIEEE